MIFIGCNNSGDKIPNTVADYSAQFKYSLSSQSTNQLPIQTLNYRDKKGLKQGRWISINKRNEKEIYTYRNDTQNGYYSIGNLGWRNEGFYKNGKIDSINRTYEGTKVLYVWFMHNAKRIWSVSFGSDGNLLVPIKGFNIPNDTSIYVKVPYPSGKTWYEGLFIRKMIKWNNRKFETTYAAGVHKIFYENGQMKGLVNYDNSTVLEFNKDGKPKESRKLEDWERRLEAPMSVILPNKIL